jgi:hypothetical protein
MDLDISYYKHDFDYGSFEEIGFYTDEFTLNLDEIQIINIDHNFISYLRAFIDLDTIKKYILHCYYHKQSKRMKMIVKSTTDRDILNIIYHAWSDFWDEDFTEHYYIKFYYDYCGELYVKDDYNLNRNDYYKYIVKRYLDLC